MYTNNPPAGAFRGFGVTQSAFAVESMMDMLAEKLGIDPVELRRMNALRVGSVTNTGQVLRESVGLLECIDKVEAEMLRLAGAATLSRRTRCRAHRTCVRAWGFAVAYKNTGLGGGAPDKAGAEVELYADGTLEVRTSSAELGQGLVTVLHMIVAEEFSLPAERCKVLVMDTDLHPGRRPDHRLAPDLCHRQRRPPRRPDPAPGDGHHPGREIRPAAGADPLYRRAGAGQRPSRARWARWSAMMRAEGREPQALLRILGARDQAARQGGDMHFAFSFAAQAAEVEVNTHDR